MPKTIESNVTFGFSFSDSNLSSHIRWFEGLGSEEFTEDTKRNFTTAKHLNELERIAKEVVENFIYAWGSETGRIKRSVTAASIEHSYGKLAVYFDPRISPSKGPFKQGGNPAEYSYAAFFQEPVRFNSFIKWRESLFERRRFRPFFSVMRFKVIDEINEHYQASTERAIKKRRPRRQS